MLFWGLSKQASNWGHMGCDILILQALNLRAVLGCLGDFVSRATLWEQGMSGGLTKSTKIKKPKQEQSIQGLAPKFIITLSLEAASIEGRLEGVAPSTATATRSTATSHTR